MSLTVSRYVVSILPHEWEIVIATTLMEFWMLERKEKKKKMSRNVGCYWFPTRYPLSASYLLTWPNFLVCHVLI